MAGIRKTVSRLRTPENTKKAEELCEGTDRFPITEGNLALCYEIIKTTTNPLIWGELVHRIADSPFSQDPAFRELLLDRLTDPTTKGARGVFLSALEKIGCKDNRSIKILCDEIRYGNFECRYKSVQLLKTAAVSLSAPQRKTLKRRLQRAHSEEVKLGRTMETVLLALGEVFDE